MNQKVAIIGKKPHNTHISNLFVLNTISPPPPFYKQQNKQRNITFLRKNNINLGKTPSALRNGFFNTNQRRKECLV